MKFYVGQKVILRRLKSYKDTIVMPMPHRWSGHKGTIIKCRLHYISYPYAVEFTCKGEKRQDGFLEDELLPLLADGEQLLFDFMSKDNESV